MEQHNPYITRLELLRLAKDIITLRYQNKRDLKEKDEPAPITTEEVVKEAEKLYAFVRDNS